jgi:hypothetical protein
MWKAKTGTDVDGVLVLDPVALQTLLAATGPVVVDGKQYDQGNVLDEIYIRQYYGITGFPSNEERRDRLSAVARAALARLNEPGWKAADLVESLKRAVFGRHVLAWSKDPTEQRGWSAAKLSGELGDDSLLLGVVNAGGNKLDRFLDARAELTVDPAASGAKTQLVVKLQNAAKEGMPQYIDGPYPGLAGARAGLYRGLLVVELPNGAREVSVVDAAGRPVQPAVAGPDGRNGTVAVAFDLDRGAQTSFTVRFTTRPGERGFDIESSARVPPVRWAYDNREWYDTRELRAEW